MSKAEKGSTVKVHYTGTLTDENNTMFDSSREREPLEFTVGAGQMIQGFDNAVEGMAVGDSKKVTIPMDEAYGPRRDEAMLTVSKTQLPQGMEPQVGMQLEATQEDGRKQLLVVADVKEEDVVLDANHPLAGKDLVFDIELVEVK
ncbi:MAG: peptidylprolyl isomerase [Flavobacteriales bacterium]|nr:peptidylprolyl isomerase [Flavobacteriales bacterium]|tara:strand:+ start:1908 stop:2342 length:435 start_codon:yes stop_codon:yes gene_type:complete